MMQLVESMKGLVEQLKLHMARLQQDAICHQQEGLSNTTRGTLGGAECHKHAINNKEAYTPQLREGGYNVHFSIMPPAIKPWQRWSEGPEDKASI